MFTYGTPSAHAVDSFMSRVRRFLTEGVQDNAPTPSVPTPLPAPIPPPPPPAPVVPQDEDYRIYNSDVVTPRTNGTSGGDCGDDADFIARYCG